MENNKAAGRIFNAESSNTYKDFPDFEKLIHPDPADSEEESSNLRLEDVLDIIQTSREHIRIVEQPAPYTRFRYKSEGDRGGLVLGTRPKSYVTIEIVNYEGPWTLTVFCITCDEPYRMHPHRLVGKKVCKNGVFTVDLTTERRYELRDLGIQATKKHDLSQTILDRHTSCNMLLLGGTANGSKYLEDCDRTKLRLCFQVYLPKTRKWLSSVFSDVITDKTKLSNVSLCQPSHTSGQSCGGLECMLLCEQVFKDNIAVNFFEKVNGVVVWEADAEILSIHKKLAIRFKTPPYKNTHIRSNVQVHLQLRRLSDNATSQPQGFLYTPVIPELKTDKYVQDNWPPQKYPLSYGPETYNIQWGTDTALPKHPSCSLVSPSPTYPTIEWSQYNTPPAEHLSVVNPGTSQQLQRQPCQPSVPQYEWQQSNIPEAVKCVPPASNIDQLSYQQDVSQMSISEELSDEFQLLGLRPTELSETRETTS